MVRTKSASVVNRVWSKTERDFYVHQYYLKKAHNFPIKSSYWEVFPDKRRRRNSDDENKKRKPTLELIMDWVKRHEELENLRNAKEEPKTEPNYHHLSSLFPTILGSASSRTRFTSAVLIKNQLNFLNRLGNRFILGGDFNAKNTFWGSRLTTTKGRELLCEIEETQCKTLSTDKLSGTKWGRKTGENRVIRTASIDFGDEHQAIKWKQGGTQWNGPRPVEKEKVLEPVVEEPQHYYYYQEPVQEEVKPDKKKVLQEKFEGKVLVLVESLNALGHAARASAFVSLRSELQRHAVHDLLAAHRATLADHVSRALRRGKDAERKAAAAVAPLLAVQVDEEGTEQFIREVRPALIATATDKSASLDTRTECCSSLAVLSYLMEDDITDILEVMRMYETIFSGSYLKEDGRAIVLCVEEGAWHAAALDGWALLLPLLSCNHALSLLNNHEPSFSRLAELLDVPSLEVRMAAGNALAIAYETATDDDNSDNPFAADVDALLPRLTELVRESHKFRAKRDRRIQRATFRDILKYFEEGEVPSTSVHIGSSRVVWSSWSDGATYAALVGALGGALQVLAPRCARLRAALALTDDLPEKWEEQEKPNKLQRHLKHRASCKARTITRKNERHERYAVITI